MAYNRVNIAKCKIRYCKIRYHVKYVTEIKYITIAVAYKIFSLKSTVSGTY